MTHSSPDRHLRLSIAWPFFLRLPRKYRSQDRQPATPERRERAQLRHAIEHDVVLFTRTHPLPSRDRRNARP